MKLEAKDSGRSLDARIQDTLTIELAENPTTGYLWSVLENGAPVLRLTQSSFARGQSPGVGAGGTRTFEFIADKAGEATLHLGYARPGDPASQKHDFLLHVHVTGR